MTPAFRLCDRCKKRPWEELWSPDGLVGHESLVCWECWQELNDHVPTLSHPVSDEA